MAEKAIFFTTGSTGDGASEYTQAEVIRWMRQMMVGDDTDEGVHKGYQNELEVTGVATPVAVNTGAAIVYGFPYWNTASVDVAIPTPSAATRIDRIVLRAAWAAQTVRITRVAGTEGAGAPALTQTDGVTWDIPLAQVSITTGGVITVTDERVFLHPNIEVETAMIEAGAIADGVQGDDFPIYRRQGGHVTDWEDAGSTTYTPGTTRIQVGARSVGVGNVDITFPVAFSAQPLILWTARVGSYVQYYYITNHATTGFRIVSSFEGPGIVDWIAIGPA